LLNSNTRPHFSRCWWRLAPKTPTTTGKFSFTICLLVQAFVGLQQAPLAARVALDYAASPAPQPRSPTQRGERIYVENAISGLKRYHIISNRVRIKKEKYRENKIVLCASIWNFYLAS